MMVGILFYFLIDLTWLLVSKLHFGLWNDVSTFQKRVD